MTLFLTPDKPVRFTEPVQLGGGAHGIVYGIADNPGVCFKVYLYPSAALDRRVTGLLRLPPADWPPTGDRRFAWPQWPLTDDSGRIRAVVLPRVHGDALHVLLHPRSRAERLDYPTWATCLQVAIRVAGLFEALHRVGVVVGDVRPDNILVDRAGRVTLIDCDSVQFTDPLTEEFFPATHATKAYCPPEALGAGDGLPTFAHDLFALGILVCQLLLEGDHPYEGVPPTGRDDGVEGNIARGDCRLFFPERLVPVPGELTPELLPPPVRELARRCFVDGHRDPRRRPTAGEWVDALTVGLNGLLGCSHTGNHFYPESLSGCPWCARREAGLGEHFPAPEQVHRDPSAGPPAGGVAHGRVGRHSVDDGGDRPASPADETGPDDDAEEEAGGGAASGRRRQARGVGRHTT